MKLTKKSETASKITFTYDRPTNTEGYRYYAGGSLVSRTFDASDLEVTFGKVPSGEYEVEAIGFSSIAKAKWPEAQPPARPSTPTGLTAQAGDGKVTLSWAANAAAEGVDGYQVYMNDATLDLDVDEVSHVVTGLTNGTAYGFRVSAHNTTGFSDWSEAVTATPVGQTPEPEPGAPPIWNGDWETGNRTQYGGLEYGGTMDGTPPVGERVIVSKGMDGVTPLQGEWFAKLITKPGDQYGSSSGWRTVYRQYDPIRKVSAGYDSWWVFGVQLPSSYPGSSTNVYQTGHEFHQTKAPYVSVTGVAPFHFKAFADRFFVDVFGGRDGQKVTYVSQNFAQNYARNVWHVVAFRYKHGLNPNGAFELWYAPKGGTLTKIVDKPAIGTMYEQTQNYMLFGLYRGQSGTQDMVSYFDALREYKNGADALAYARSLL